MRRRLVSLILSFAMVLGICTCASASSVDEFRVINTKDGTLYKGHEKAIEYIEDAQGYYLENVTKDDFLNAMDDVFGEETGFSSKQITSVQPSDEFLKKSERVLTEKGIDISSAKAATYTQSYSMYDYITPPFDDQPLIKIRFSVTMRMTTVTHGGKEYAQFVEFISTSRGALESGSYEFADGTGEPTYIIEYGGAVISVFQEIQLQTTTTYSSDASIGGGWFTVGVSVGNNYYLRSELQSCRSSVTLPLKDIVA